MNTKIAYDVSTVVLPMITAIKQLSNEVKHMYVHDVKDKGKIRKHDPEAKTALERARRGHCMCGEDCDICKMASNDNETKSEKLPKLAKADLERNHEKI